MKTLEFIPVGVCSRKMEIDYEDGVIVDLRVTGGCNGNLKGISALVKGLPFTTVIEKLAGTKCGGKSTSCPDQIATALKSIK